MYSTTHKSFQFKQRSVTDGFGVIRLAFLVLSSDLKNQNIKLNYITTKILCFNENFSENFVLIIIKDFSIVRTINSPHKI